MSIFARRYHWSEVHPFENTLLLNALSEKPEYVTYPATAEQRRVGFAAMLTDPANIHWVSYSDKSLTGVILLSRIVPNVDALLHFLFLDGNLVSKRKLLQGIISVCFTDFGLHRLSMEVPEGVRLERFARKVLGFRYEGEARPRSPELPPSLTDNWVAKQGSRAEQAHFNGTEWKDILRLRLLASEWVGDTGEGEANECLGRSQPPHQSSAG